jgi:hypothetical protein
MAYFVGRLDDIGMKLGQNQKETFCGLEMLSKDMAHALWDIITIASAHTSNGAKWYSIISGKKKRDAQ